MYTEFNIDSVFNSTI